MKTTASDINYLRNAAAVRRAAHELEGELLWKLLDDFSALQVKNGTYAEAKAEQFTEEMREEIGKENRS